MQILIELKELKAIMRENNQLLRDLINKQNHTAMVKVQEAAKILSISPATIRDMCEKGLIKAAFIGKGLKNKHWVINIDQAMEDLTKGGYLQIIADKHKTTARRGKKPSLNLNL